MADSYTTVVIDEAEDSPKAQEALYVTEIANLEGQRDAVLALIAHEQDALAEVRDRLDDLSDDGTTLELAAKEKE